MTKYRITTNSGKFRIEYFVGKSWIEKGGWYPLSSSETAGMQDWFEYKGDAQEMIKKLERRDRMNSTPWVPVDDQ